MAKMIPVIVSRKSADGEWMVRNNRINHDPRSHAGKLGYDHERAMKLANEQLQEWRAAEPGTTFAVLEVDFHSELAQRGMR